jgi:hypothetical protein
MSPFITQFLLLFFQKKKREAVTGELMNLADTMASRQRSQVPIDPAIHSSPSGRFEACIEATKGSNLLFSYLRRRMEGRALRAVGPPTEHVLTDGGGSLARRTLSGTVAELLIPPRWPYQVSWIMLIVILSFFCTVESGQLISWPVAALRNYLCSHVSPLLFLRRYKASGSAPSVRMATGLVNYPIRPAWRLHPMPLSSSWWIVSTNE